MGKNDDIPLQHVIKDSQVSIKADFETIFIGIVCDFVCCFHRLIFIPICDFVNPSRS